MAAERSPAFQFYPKDFLTDERVRLMSHAERGIYITLLSMCWLEGSLPAEPHQLAKLVEVPLERFKRLWAGTLGACFQATSDGRLSQKRLDQERQKQDEYRARKVAAGQRGGRSKALAEVKQNPSKALAEGVAKPSSSSSSSVSYLQKEREKESLSDPFTNQDITTRAGDFIRRYRELYPIHRSGARYVGNENRDYQAAVRLCETWTDAVHLEKLAVCFLTTNHKFAAEGSRTIPQMKALASWLDGEYQRWLTTQ